MDKALPLPIGAIDDPIDTGKYLTQARSETHPADIATQTATSLPELQPAIWSLRNRRSPSKDSVRLALYSHDTLGLGHTRRNLLIAKALTMSGVQLDILLITGTRATAKFELPPGVDCLTLPSLHKDEDGAYSSRSLDISLRDIQKLRAETIWAALKAFKPDLFLVDNVPRGAAGELNLSLKKLKRKGRTRCVLGLRDILDEPQAVHRQWREQKNEAAIQDFYDAVWIYGDPSIYDLVNEYGFGRKIDNKISYLGYFNPRLRIEATRPPSNETMEILSRIPEHFVLCQVGGGQDGFRLAEAFIQTEFSAGMCGVLITGPFMPASVRRYLHSLAVERPHLQIIDFLAEPTELLLYASRIISMGGYNTVLEALAFEKPLLVVPRVKPRSEQLIRAERFQQLGLLDLMLPDTITPTLLNAWLSHEKTPVQVHERLDFNAANRLCSQIEEVLGRRLIRRRTNEGELDAA